MSKNVTFHLGPADSLTSRNLTITRMPGAGDDDAIVASHDTDHAGSTEVVTVELDDNQIWQAVLTDTRTSGEVGRKDVLNFHTGSLQFPGPRSGDRLQILSMEDLSSSSSSSSTSSSSSSSESSSSSS